MDSTSFDLPSTSTSHQEMSGIETQPMFSPIREIEGGYKVSRSDNSIMIGNNYKMTPKKTRRKCRFCDKYYLVSTASSNLKNHLKRFHPNALHESLQNASSSLFGVKILSPSENLNLNKLILKYFVDENISINSFDSDSFKNIFKYINKYAKIWCRQSASKYLSKIYITAKNQMIANLKKVKSQLSITTDLWTGINSKSYMALTIHYIDNDWSPKNYLLDFIEIPHPHTSEEICAIIIDSLEKFNIINKITSITHDNASNILLASEYMKKFYMKNYSKEFYSHRCLAHILNIVVKEGLDSFSSLLENVDRFVRKIHRSPKMMQEFLTLSGGTKIPIDVATRWNSKYLMIRSINQNIDAIFKFCKKFDDEYHINNEDSIFLKELESFLYPFYKITNEISSETITTVGLSVLYINTIMTSLERTEISNASTQIKKAASKMKEKCKIYSEHMETFANYVCAFLDPRIKKKYIPTFLNKATYLDHFKILYNQHNPENLNVYDIDNELNPSNLMSVTIFNDLRKEAYQYPDPAREEMEDYIGEVVAKPTIHVLDWWSSNSTRFPKLAMMARDFFSHQSTSVPSERTFSRAVDTLTKKRNRISSTKLNECLSLKSWKFNFLTLKDDFYI